MGIKSISSSDNVIATPTPAVQSSTGDLPRSEKDYRKYLSRLSLEGLKSERTKKQEEYEKYGKRWDDYGHVRARKGERAYPTYQQLLAIDAEFKTNRRQTQLRARGY